MNPTIETIKLIKILFSECNVEENYRSKLNQGQKIHSPIPSVSLTEGIGDFNPAPY